MGMASLNLKMVLNNSRRFNNPVVGNNILNNFVIFIDFFNYNAKIA